MTVRRELRRGRPPLWRLFIFARGLRLVAVPGRVVVEMGVLRRAGLIDAGPGGGLLADRHGSARLAPGRWSGPW